MIRINLLAVERERTKKRTVLIPAAHRVTIIASLVLLTTVLGIGWWFWSLRQQSAALDSEIAKAQIETQQLRGVLAQVQKFESRKAQLQQRVTLIEQLRRGQAGPVHVLDEISRSLPDRLWLTAIEQKDNDFTISGITTSLTAVSDFIANLESTKWFKKPVEIIDSEVASDATAGDLFKFSLKAVFNDANAPPGAPAANAPPGPAATKTGP